MNVRYLVGAVLLASVVWGNAAQGAQRAWHHPSWMEGCWAYSGSDTKEIWDAGFDGLLFGRTTTIRDGELTFFEDLRIERRETTLVFSASPNGAPPVEFVSVRQTPASITFENPLHDFPQRVHYKMSSEGMTAVISDIEGENKAVVEMTACQAA